MHYVMSDIHGDMNAFAKIMSMIDLLICSNSMKNNDTEKAICEMIILPE